MRRSFVLKDQSGRAVGYMQQVQDEVRCRITHSDDRDGAEVIVFYDNGSSSRHAVSLSGVEHVWKKRESGILGACVMCHTSRIADTGKEVRLLMAQCIGREPPPRTDEPQAAAAVLKPKAAQMPQRRWPPHPCCPNASYVNGRWRFDQKE